MKKRIIALLLAVLMILSMTACGSKPDTTTDDNKASDAETTPETPAEDAAAEEPKEDADTTTADGEVEYTIQWFVGSSMIENGDADFIREKFIAAYPQYDINIVESDMDASGTLTAIAGGEQIDCFWGDFYTILEGGAGGTFLPLNEFFEKDGVDFTDLYGEFCYNTSTIDGQIYGVPQYYNTFKVFYNKTMADEKGITIPSEWTWDEFVETAKKFEDPDNGVKYGAVMSIAWTQTWAAMANNMGWYLTSVDDEGNVSVNLDDERLETVMQAVYDLGAVDHAIPTYTEYSAESINRRAELANQRTGMIIDGPFTFVWLKNYMFNDPGEGNLPFEVGVAELPSFPGGENCSYATNVGLWGIPKTCGNPEAAYRFIRFIENEDPDCAALMSAYMSTYTKWDEQGVDVSDINYAVFSNFTDIYGEKHTDIYSHELVDALCTIPHEFCDVYWNFNPNLYASESACQAVFDEQFSTFMSGEVDFDTWVATVTPLMEQRLADSGLDHINLD